MHTGTFGDPDNLEVPGYSPTPTDYGFEVDYRSTVGNYPHGGKVGEPGFEWLRHFEAFVPFTATITIHFPHGAILNIMNAASRRPQLRRLPSRTPQHGSERIFHRLTGWRCGSVAECGAGARGDRVCSGRVVIDRSVANGSRVGKGSFIAS